MKLSELIQHVGDDNVVLQNIMASSPQITSGKKDGRVTFYTDCGKAADLAKQAVFGIQGEWTGLVVWLPTSKLPAS